MVVFEIFIGTLLFIGAALALGKYAYEHQKA